MNRRQLLTSSLAGFAAVAMRIPVTKAEADLDKFKDQLLAAPEGAVSRAMRRFTGNGDDALELGYFVTVFDSEESAKTWFEMERDNTVAFYDELDLTEGPVEAVLIEVTDKEKVGADTFVIRQPADQYMRKHGSMTVHAYKGIVHLQVELSSEEKQDDLLKFMEKHAQFDIEDPLNKKQLLALIPTEKDANKFAKKMKKTSEEVAFRSGDKWEKQ
jgi:hypothetical protein